MPAAQVFSVEPPIEQASGRFGCPVCDERFTSVGDKKRHLRQEHP